MKHIKEVVEVLPMRIQMGNRRTNGEMDYLRYPGRHVHNAQRTGTLKV